MKKNSTVYIGKLYECTGGVCTKYIFGRGSRIAMKSSGTANYYHADHLGSSSIVTNAGGAKVEDIQYYTYGATRSNTGSVNVKHKYTGQEEDAETGLYYYGARYYDPLIGRFISADTIVPAPGDPQSLNRYSYVSNNPLRYKDPSGRAATPFHMASEFIGASAGGLFGADQTPFSAAAFQLALDVDGMKYLRNPDYTKIHATAYRQERGEALSNAWSSFTDNLGHSDTVGKANHTFYDILTHWGGEFNPNFELGKLSTWTAGDLFHFVVNDTILGLLFLPVAIVESVATNIYNALFGNSQVATWDAGRIGGYDFGGYDFGYDLGGYDFGGYGFGGYDFGGYDYGGYDFGGYDFGGYDFGGYDFGGYDFGGYDYGDEDW